MACSKQKRKILAIMQLLVLVAVLPPNFAIAQNTQSQTIYFSQMDRQNYSRAFNFANSGDEIATNAAIETIIDSTLIAFLKRNLLLKTTSPKMQDLQQWLIENGEISGADLVYDRALALYPNGQFARPQITANRRSFARVRAPKEIAENLIPGFNANARAQLEQIKAHFAANSDFEVIKAAQLSANSAIAGRAAWFGGLSAYRIGDFEKAEAFFTFAANWQYSDETAKSAAGFWAARAARKLNHSATEVAMLELAATQPLSFYGQLALAKLGRWQSLNIPNQSGEIEKAREILKNYAGARRALALYDLGQISDAQNELLAVWNSAPNSLDLGFLYISHNLGFKELNARISESSNSAYIATNYPIAQNLTPEGGSFILDRALIYAIMRQESRFNSGAVSYAGARGLMQLMPSTAAWMTGRNELKYNPELLHDEKLNLALGEGYLERVMKMPAIDNSVARTLMAYNAGPGALARWANRIQMSEDTLMLIEATPVTQTRDYVKKVMSNLWIYHKRLGQNAPTLERLAHDRSPYYEPQDNPRLTSQSGFQTLTR